MSKKKQEYFPPPQLPCTGVESHAHLNSKQFADDFEAVLSRAKDAGVANIMQVFLSPEAWQQGKDRFANHPHVYFLLGIHPTEAHLHTDAVVRDIRKAIQEDDRIRAIGEIGLDYYWKDCPPEVQKSLFRSQLTLAKELNLPVVIHCREAEEDTFAILEESGFAGYPLLWHCFGGNTVMAERIIRNGWHASIPGPVTYPANTTLREAVAAFPLERLLVETDCPYLSPVPHRGKRNEPAYLGYTIAAMAEARTMDVTTLWTQCGDNARKFFRIAS